MTDRHLGLLMLGLIVVAIMLGFPTAFTLLGWACSSATTRWGTTSSSCSVQRAFGVMSNDVLIAIPLFVFMGYLVERANILDRLFQSLHLAASASRARSRWRRSSPAPCSRPPPASSAPS